MPVHFRLGLSLSRCNGVSFRLGYKGYLAKIMGQCRKFAFYFQVGESVFFQRGRKKGTMVYHGLTPNSCTYLIFKIWENVPKPFIERLYNSMPARIGAVIKTKGFMTKY